jgi:hypothetical protein
MTNGNGKWWDIFAVDSSEANLQIQRIDSPDDGSKPHFENDTQAVKWVKECADKGDAECIDAIQRTKGSDQLVQKVLNGTALPE